MAATATPAVFMTTTNPCIYSSRKRITTSTANFSTQYKEASLTRLTSSSHISSRQPLFQSFTLGHVKSQKIITRAMSGADESKPLPGLPIDLRGQTSISFPNCIRIPFIIRCQYHHLVFSFSIMAVAH
jgi:enoyl-[acyl-carrier protein] reductase I